jgi:hypothetical protein
MAMAFWYSSYLYPTEKWDVAWNLREMGYPGGGNEGGPGPPSREQDKQLTVSRGGDNSLMKQEEDGKKGQA